MPGLEPPDAEDRVNSSGAYGFIFDMCGVEVDDTGRVEIGSIVTVEDEEGDLMEFLLAPAENRGSAALVVSPTSPLGQAVLAKSPGDLVSYDAPGGTFEVKVTAVRPFAP